MNSTTAYLLIAGAFFLGYLLGRRAPAAQPLPPPASPDPDVLRIFAPQESLEGKIAAIKAYRERTGAGLRDAKLAVETLE